MFTYYELETASEEAKPLMEQSLKTFKMIPNLHKVLAEAPATYEAYNTVFSLFMKNTSLSPLEQQVVFMTSKYLLTTPLSQSACLYPNNQIKD